MPCLSIRRLSAAFAVSIPLLLSASPVRAAGLTEDEARTLTREVSARVEAIRGLKFKRPVAVKLVDDAVARQHFQKRLEKFWPPEQVALEQKAHAQLGLLPPGTDVVDSLLDLLEEQAGGYYDPASDTFFILTDMPRSVAPVLFAHELTHALDDQHFDLDARLMEATEDDDRGTAVGAVIEGSGMLVMSAYVVAEMAAGRLTPAALLELHQSEAGKAEKLSASPPLLQRLLLAPYLLGHAFLLRGDLGALTSGVKPEDIDRAFTSPPVSTEQILHPAKYWNDAERDTPREVVLPDLSSRLGKDWKLRLDGNLGELTLAVLAGAAPIDPRSPDAARPAGWTTAAAAGWDGDRYQLYEGPKGNVTVLATVWDSTADATEFEAALVKAAPKVRARRGDAVVLIAASDGVPVEGLSGLVLDAVAPRAQPAAGGGADGPRPTSHKPSR
jgi:hypothetical protein